MSESNGTYVILNGDILPCGKACVKVDDRGFLYGDSVFTTMRCYNGVPFRLERHCARLNASLRSPVLEIDYEVSAEKLGKDIRHLVELNRCPDSMARFAVTRGRGFGPLPPPNPEPTTILTVRPYIPNVSLYIRGASLMVSSVRRDPAGQIGKHKLGSYFQCLLARREANAAGFDEAVICDTNGNYLECSSSNIFAVVNGVLVTPDATGNLLPGIARETVLECAAELGIMVNLEDLTSALMKQAEEVFITNSGVEVMPVARFGKIKCTAPGSLTARLMQTYSELAVRETTAK